MRLINSKTFYLEEFHGDQIPPYAILSHTWRDEEVLFDDWEHYERRVGKAGWSKVMNTCRQARLGGHEYVWIDSVCIDKKSSAELSEAINSMYQWYTDAARCFVYLDDFHHNGNLKGLQTCRWFSRGWTLQELLAPRYLKFYDQSWIEFGQINRYQGVASIDTTGLCHALSVATGIDEIWMSQAKFQGHQRLTLSTTVAERMSWVAGRETNRIEDMAYCLMGLFNVNMPLLYGEGPTAFIRLQEEIIKHSNDPTLFCWEHPTSYRTWQGCLAPSPDAFINFAKYLPDKPLKHYSLLNDFAITNVGLKATVLGFRCGPIPLRGFIGNFLAILTGANDDEELLEVVTEGPGLGILLESSGFSHLDYYEAKRKEYVSGLIRIPGAWTSFAREISLNVKHERRPEPHSESMPKKVEHVMRKLNGNGFAHVARKSEGRIGILPLYGTWRNGDDDSDKSKMTLPYIIDRRGNEQIPIWLLPTGEAGCHKAHLNGEYESDDKSIDFTISLHVQMCEQSTEGRGEEGEDWEITSSIIVQRTPSREEVVLDTITSTVPKFYQLDWVTHRSSKAIRRVRPMLIEFPGATARLDALLKADTDGQTTLDRWLLP